MRTVKQTNSSRGYAERQTAKAQDLRRGLDKTVEGVSSQPSLLSNEQRGKSFGRLQPIRRHDLLPTIPKERLVERKVTCFAVDHKSFKV